MRCVAGTILGCGAPAGVEEQAMLVQIMSRKRLLRTLHLHRHTAQDGRADDRLDAQP